MEERHKDDVDQFETADETTTEEILVAPEADPVESKTKQELKIEVHQKLVKYLEKKRLRDELTNIDGW